MAPYQKKMIIFNFNYVFFGGDSPIIIFTEIKGFKFLNGTFINTATSKSTIWCAGHILNCPRIGFVAPARIAVAFVMTEGQVASQELKSLLSSKTIFVVHFQCLLAFCGCHQKCSFSVILCRAMSKEDDPASLLLKKVLFIGWIEEYACFCQLCGFP